MVDDCCKEEKYNLLLKIEPWQKNDLSEQVKISNGLISVLNWSESKSKAAVDFAVLQGQFLIKQGPTQDMTRLSLKLAENHVPHQLIKSKK
jgi:hypothetical protein